MRIVSAMMLFGMFSCSLIVLTGCSADATSDEDGKSDSEYNSQSEKVTTENPLISTDSGLEMDLKPANAKVEFIGTHVGEPNPRHGGFGEFTGKVTFSDDAVTGFSLDIKTASIWTEIENLTNHLKSPDFFNAREHPSATFATTDVTAPADESGEYTVKGDLTILGNTKEITFPATAKVDGATVTLNAEFMIDRTLFGMTFGPDRVEKEVKIMFAIGEASNGAG